MTAPRSLQTARQRRRKPRQERALATVSFVLDAAAQVFAERGYAATTNEIAARAGVSVGSLYQYFADKDALLVALAERHLAEAQASLQSVLEDAPTEPDQLVRRVIEAAVDLNRPSALHTVLYQAAPRTPELVEVLDRVRHDLAAAVAALLAEAGVDAPVADRRGHALVVAVDAAIHEHVLAATTPEDESARINDVVTLTTATLAAYTR
ncbi:MAG: TetR/AcrR family transcriptional regulator [Dermatophilaceae bacterium]|nr:TetR/AcrR family transcriptional regulator [Intrasporangiaceae bacterium]